MNRWLELTRAALLGTQRTPLPDLADESLLGQLLGAMDESRPEQTLLQMAGTLDLYEQVGRQPQQLAPSELKPAPDRTPGSPKVTQRLAMMLDGQHRDLLHEYLAAMAAANLTIPAALLPDLLERGQKTALLRPFLLPVLGGNGRWLAAQNPNWAYAAAESVSWDGLMKQWLNSGKTDRHALLRQLRHTDPALGRALVASTWKSEAPPNRISFIRLLETGLSMADEPFLEAALDDREAQVRRKAVELLACLPQSRLCQRMAANSEPILGYYPKRAYQIVPTIPIPLNDEMLRDGVQQIPPNLTGNTLARARSRQLTQIIGAIPLDHWSEIWQITPEEVVQAVQKSRWPRTLIQALAAAVQRQRNVTWAVALANQADFNNVAKMIVPVLTPEIVQMLVQRFRAELADDVPPLHKDSPLLKMLRFWPHDWDAEMALIWTDLLVQQIVADEKPSPFFRTAVKQLSRSCPPESVDGMVTAVSPHRDTPGWRPILREMVRVLRFRHEMYNEVRG